MKLLLAILLLTSTFVPLVAQEEISFYEKKSDAYVGVSAQALYFLPLENPGVFSSRNIGGYVAAQVLGNITNLFGLGGELGIRVMTSRNILVEAPLRLVSSFDFELFSLYVYGGTILQMYAGDLEDSALSISFDVGIRGARQLGGGKLFLDIGYVLPVDPILASQFPPITRFITYLNNGITFGIGYQLDIVI